MKHHGKSYKQWFKEVEHMIHKRGFSQEYANAQVVCARSLYNNKHDFIAPEYVANYVLRNVIGGRRKIEIKMKNKEN